MSKKQENYLEKIPVKSEKLTWVTDETGLTTLEIENKGFFNRLFQWMSKK